MKNKNLKPKILENVHEKVKQIMKNKRTQSIQKTPKELPQVFSRNANGEDPNL